MSLLFSALKRVESQRAAHDSASDPAAMGATNPFMKMEKTVRPDGGRNGGHRGGRRGGQEQNGRFAITVLGALVLGAGLSFLYFEKISPLNPSPLEDKATGAKLESAAANNGTTSASEASASSTVSPSVLPPSVLTPSVLTPSVSRGADETSKESLAPPPRPALLSADSLLGDGNTSEGQVNSDAAPSASAITDLQVTGDAPEVEALLSAAYARALSGDAGSAAALYRKALTIDPDQTAAMDGLAAALLLRGQARQALLLLQKTRESAPYSEAREANYLLALAQLAPREARAFNELRQLAATRADAKTALGEVFAARGELARAENLWLDAARQTAGGPLAERSVAAAPRLKLAVLYDRQGQEQKAAAYYREALALGRETPGFPAEATAERLSFLDARLEDGR